MTSQIVVRSSPVTTKRRQPLLSVKSPANSPAPPRKNRKSTSNVGEVAGGTTAEVFVVCCCCPCVLFEFVVLAVYKVPATVVRLVWKKQRHKLPMIKKRRKKKTLLEQAKEVHHSRNNQVVPNPCSGSGRSGRVQCYHSQHLNVVGYLDELSDVDLEEFEIEKVEISIDGSAEAVELDKQMWDRFRNAGFWRSPSQRLEDDD